MQDHLHETMIGHRDAVRGGHYQSTFFTLPLVWCASRWNANPEPKLTLVEQDPTFSPGRLAVWHAASSPMTETCSRLAFPSTGSDIVG